MKAVRTFRIALGMVVGLFAVRVLSALMTAEVQMVPAVTARSLAAAPPGRTAGIVIVVTLVVLLLLVVVVAVGVKLFDLTGKREVEAERLEEKVSLALRRDHRLAHLWIVPVVYVPTSPQAPVTVEVVGRVPTREARNAALQVVAREISQSRPHPHIEDRIDVEPTERIEAA